MHPQGKDETKVKAYERLLQYVTFWTTSDEESATVPSTARQLVLAQALRDEMTALGISAVRLSDTGYVYGIIPATPGYEDRPALGFIAHMDTAPDFNGEGVRPRLIPQYDGREIVLGDSGRVLSPTVFPHLPGLAGRTLIVTDGTTLLGADDKAGIAEIMTMAECLLRQDIPHGKVCIAFTPDEEIGRGPDDFDVPGFGANFAYTVDGDVEGSIEYQNFNAAAAVFRIRGVNVHPGSAKDVMINAALVAMDINSRLPAADIPARTDGYEGFFHLTDMEGNVESAELKYIIRDHDAAGFDARLALLRRIADDINASLGDGTVTLTIREQYRNMAEKIQPHMHLIRNAERAAHSVGAEPAVHPIRGGTDGARLSFMGLPCPNLGTGGYAFHGPYEHITVEGMDTETAILLELVRLYADQAGDAD